MPRQLDDSSLTVQLLLVNLNDHHHLRRIILTPQSGEELIFADGRRFTLAAVENGVRGWWFTARAHDGRSTVQGNLRLTWDSQARAWRPDGKQPVAPQPGPIRRTPQQEYQQQRE